MTEPMPKDPGGNQGENEMAEHLARLRHLDSRRVVLSRVGPAVSVANANRLRKKGFFRNLLPLSVSPRGREVKESGHLLCRVRNARIYMRAQSPFFPHPAKHNLRSGRRGLDQRYQQSPRRRPKAGTVWIN